MADAEDPRRRHSLASGDDARDAADPPPPPADSPSTSSSGRSSSSRGWGARGPVATLVNELVDALRPTAQSERRRRAVFQHIAQLVEGCFAGEDVLVTAFGSVPLRTYLPDGDIDVCLLGPHELLSKDSWTTRLREHIEDAETMAAAHCAATGDPPCEFAVSEIHVIHAEVKLMKCICDGVVVDISANQFGGLATLGFLEEVDAFIARGGIFKRSVLLIKAWAFYEARLLGAHHALVSTYALETLVLFILNAFHERLATPLEVLHEFLRYFAEFDWDRDAVSILGPVRLADLGATSSHSHRPGALGELEKNFPENSLLTREFLWRMLDKYGHDSIMREMREASAAGRSNSSSASGGGARGGGGAHGASSPAPPPRRPGGRCPSSTSTSSTLCFRAITSGGAFLRATRFASARRSRLARRA